MIDINRLATVLKHANSAPPYDEEKRAQFYALKEHLCRAYGQLVGEDIQHIRKECWGCGGTGIWYSEYDYDKQRGTPCNRCIKGVYSEKWIILERWQLGTCIFHRPSRITAGSLVKPTIEGFIRHKRSKLATACQEALALVFNPSWSLYINTFEFIGKSMRRFKMVLAYLLGCDRRKWDVKALRMAEVQQVASEPFAATGVI